MSDQAHLSAPRKGDIWIQVAMKDGPDDGKSPKIKLLMSDNQGMMTQSMEMARHSFEGQFHQDPGNATKWIKRVRIEESTTTASIGFIRLDEDGKPS